MLTLMEQINPEFLYQYRVFYALSRDATNFLTVINSSATFLIYMIFGKEFRKELLRTWRPLLPLARSSSVWQRPASLELTSSASSRTYEDSGVIEMPHNVVLSNGMLTVNGQPLKDLMCTNAQVNEDGMIGTNYGSNGKTAAGATESAFEQNGLSVRIYMLEPYGVRV